MKVIVTGSRHWRSRQTVFDVLDRVGPRMVVVGDCPTGADRWAREWCEEHDTPGVVFEADWGRWGRRAGPVRNQHMVETHRDADVCLVFLRTDGPSKGTRDCARRARRAGVRVEHVYA